MCGGVFGGDMVARLGRSIEPGKPDVLMAVARAGGCRGDEDFSQRYTARFRGPDIREATGEMSHDDGLTWRPDVIVAYRRVEQEADGD